jgi:hypothetical protein
MDVFALQDDGSERLLATDLDSSEVIELQEQWSYTKPFGSGIKIVVRANVQTLFGFRTTGTETGVADQTRPSEIFIG